LRGAAVSTAAVSYSKHDMEEVGRVVEVSGDTVKVELEGSEKCGHCGAKILCHPNSNNKMYIEAINKAEAKLGDKVKIEIVSGTSIFATFLLFIVPIIVFIVVFVTANILTRNENFAVLSGFGGLVLFFLFLIRINHKIARNRKFCPVAKEIIERNKLL